MAPRSDHDSRGAAGSDDFVLLDHLHLERRGHGEPAADRTRHLGQREDDGRGVTGGYRHGPLSGSGRTSDDHRVRLRAQGVKGDRRRARRRPVDRDVRARWIGCDRQRARCGRRRAVRHLEIPHDVCAGADCHGQHALVDPAADAHGVRAWTDGKRQRRHPSRLPVDHDARAVGMSDDSQPAWLRPRGVRAQQLDLRERERRGRGQDDERRRQHDPQSGARPRLLHRCRRRCGDGGLDGTLRCERQQRVALDRGREPGFRAQTSKKATEPRRPWRCGF